MAINTIAWEKVSTPPLLQVIKHYEIIKGVVDCFFSRLDCVYGVQSNMC